MPATAMSLRSRAGLEAPRHGLPGAALGAVLAAAVGCAGPVSRLPIPEAAADWRPFYWARVRADTTVFDRAAIMVSDTGSRTAAGALLQLDLAGSGTLPLGFPTIAGAGGSNRRATLHGLLTGLEPIEAVGRDSTISPVTQVGTYGVPRFEYDVLLLDLAGRRIGTMPSTSSVPAGLWPAARTVPVRWDGSRVLVPVSVPDGPTLNLLLDTGLSPFQLWTRREVWEALTGAGAATTRYVIPHPAGELQFIGALTRTPVALGGVAIGRLEVVYLERGPDAAHPERWPFAVDGVLGPSSLDRAGLLVLDIRRRRLSLPGR